MLCCPGVQRSYHSPHYAGPVRGAHAHRAPRRAAEAGMGHIELARWADVMIIAPATADDRAARTGPGRRLADHRRARHTRACRGSTGDESADVGPRRDSGQYSDGCLAGHSNYRPRCRRTGCGDAGRADCWNLKPSWPPSTRALKPAGRAPGSHHRGTDHRSHRPGSILEQPQLRKNGLCTGRGLYGRRAG